MNTISRASQINRACATVLLVFASGCSSATNSTDTTINRDSGSRTDSGPEAPTPSTDGGLPAGEASTPDGGQPADASAERDASSSPDGGSAADHAPAAAVRLGAAQTFVILAKSGISTVPTARITGNLGVSPAAASYVTGFSLTADATNVFSTSPQVTGNVYAADHSSPTPSNLTTAVLDMQAAFTDAAGRAPDTTELGAGNVGGKTLPPGVYKWGTGLLIPTDVTLSGPASGVWIFQIAKDLTISSGARTVLAGGALPENVFWQVAGQVELGTTAHIDGIVLAQTAIMLRTGASSHGRLFSQTAVVLDASSVVQPDH